MPPLLLAASHAVQRLTGSEEVRSCESWEAVKYPLGSKWQIHHRRSGIHHLKEIDVLLGQKEIGKGAKGRHEEGEILHLSPDCSFNRGVAGGWEQSRQPDIVQGLYSNI